MIYEFYFGVLKFYDSAWRSRICTEIQKVGDAYRKLRRHRVARAQFFRRASKIIPLREVRPRVFLTPSRRPAVDRIERPLMNKALSTEKPKADVQLKMQVKRRFLSDDGDLNSHGL